ncbi:PDZ domain-containing protein, partial [Haematococcus lacustris]
AAPDLVDISVTPDLAKDGKGRLGVGLYPNSYIERLKSAWLTSTVVGGLTALFTNFGKVAGQLSGPVAIVAAGSQIAKTDAAGLFQ